MARKQSYNEKRKIRYHVYRRLGYDSKQASKLSNRSLDVRGLELSERTGTIKRNTATKNYVQAWKERDEVEGYIKKTKSFKNDSTLTDFGMLTHDKRYKGETGKVVDTIRTQTYVKYNPKSGKLESEQIELSSDQAYYFYYMMNDHYDENDNLIRGLSFKQAQEQLLSSKEFEMYAKKRK